MSPKTIVMMTSPTAVACSRPEPAMIIATGEARTTRAATAKELMSPTVRTPIEKSDFTAAVSWSAAFLLSDVKRAVARETAMSECGSMKTR